MHDIVLVKLPSDSNFATPPLGIGYIFKALRNVPGIRPVFIDAHRDRLDLDGLLSRLKQTAPLVVGFQAFSVEYPFLRKAVPRTRELFPNARILAGGPHPTGLPERVLLENPDLDYVVQSEGEEPVRELVEGLIRGDLGACIGEIPNLIFREDGKIRTNPCRLVDVREYGMPDWEILEPRKYPAVQHGTFHKSTRVAPILTSRGCPYPCTFCAGHTLTGKKIRARDVDDVLDEIQFLQTRFGIEEFIVEDENFTFRKERVLAFAHGVRRRDIRCWFSFPNGIRLDRIDAEIVRAMRAMGTYQATLGIESGSPRTLKAMRKNWNLEEVREKIRLLQDNGIVLLGSFILGFPTETMDDVNQTIDFAVDSGIDTAVFGNFLPLPGSEEFKRLEREGELQPDRIDWGAYTSYFGRLPYHPKGITEKQLLRAVRRATVRFYTRPKILWGLLKRMSRPVFVKSLVFRIFRLFARSPQGAR